MSATVEFHEITSDDEASVLMPGEDDSLHLVLFCHKDAPTVERARQLAPRVDIPSNWDIVVLDAEKAPETASWYGVDETSGMAVIRDGSLLDIEYECSLDAFRRLIETAKRQAEALTNLG